MRASKYVLTEAAVARIRQRMRAPGIELDEKGLALATGQSHAHIYRVLQRKDGIGVPLLLSMCRVLGLTPDQLIWADSTADSGSGMLALSAETRWLGQKIDEGFRTQAAELEVLTKRLQDRAAGLPDANPPHTPSATPPEPGGPSSDKP